MLLFLFPFLERTESVFVFPLALWPLEALACAFAFSFDFDEVPVAKVSLFVCLCILYLEIPPLPFATPMYMGATHGSEEVRMRIDLKYWTRRVRKVRRVHWMRLIG